MVIVPADSRPPAQQYPATCLCEAVTKYFKDIRIRTGFFDEHPDFEDLEFKILGITGAEKVLDAVKDFLENGEVWV